MSAAEEFYATVLCLALLGLTVIFYGAIAMARSERRAAKQEQADRQARDDKAVRVFMDGQDERGAA